MMVGFIRITDDLQAQDLGLCICARKNMTPDEKQTLFDEQEAEAKAGAEPMIHIGTGSGTTWEIAASTGKRVIQRAIEAGVPDAAVQAMRKRMLKWLEMCVAFEKDRLEIRRDDNLTTEQQNAMIAAMNKQQNIARIGIFGE